MDRWQVSGGEPVIWGELRKGDVIRDPDTGADWTIESFVPHEHLGYVDTWLSDGTVHYPVRKPWTEQAAIVARLPENLEPTMLGISDDVKEIAALTATPPQDTDPLVVYGSEQKRIRERLHGGLELAAQRGQEQAEQMRESLERGLEQAARGEVSATARAMLTAPGVTCHLCGEGFEEGDEVIAYQSEVVHTRCKQQHQNQYLNPPVVQDPELTKTLDEEMEAAQVAFGNDRLELLATETVEETAAREGATKEEPLLLPPIDTALALRSHLYLVHDLYVPDLDPRGPSAGAALKEHHRLSHIDGPMPHPHTHEGTAV